MFRILSTIFGLSLCLLLLTGGVNAQQTEGRWAIGLSGGTNLWFNDLNQMKLGFGGAATVRYGFTPVFSLGLFAGMEELKSSQSPLSPIWPIPI